MTDPCPPDDELLGYVARSLPPQRRDQIETHLASCDTCPTVAAAAAREIHASLGGGDDEVAASSGEHLLAIGETLGRYVILELVGRGSMGVVYAAYDPKLDRKIALKVVRPDRRHAGLEARFVREGQMAARLSHPNIVAVHDAGVLDADGGVFLAMAYVQGVTLRAWLAAEPRSWRAILAAYLDAGRGLAAAHRAGVIHRDFKPDNVMVGHDGEVRVTDFGLARFAEGSESAAGVAEPEAEPAVTETAHGTVVGTPAFMAPEQLRGERVTPAADQFAFASALYQALYGQHPFGGEGYTALRRAVLAGVVREPPRSPVPAPVRRALVRALQPAPAARFRRIDDLLTALEAAPGRRRRVLTWAAVGLGLAAVVAVWRLAGGGASPADPCRAGGERVLASWNAEAEAAIRQAFDATGLPSAPGASEHARRELAAYASRWTAGYRAACEATHVRGEQSAVLLDRRMGCLDERLRDLAATAAQLAHADRGIVEKTPELLEAMRSIETCADRTRMLAQVAQPDDPATVARVASVRDELAALRAALTAGKVGPELLARADDAVGRADDAGYPLVGAEARVVRGRFQFSNGKLDEAITGFEAAALAGERLGDDDLGEEALLELAVAYSGAQLGDDAVRAVTLAEAKAIRLGGAPLLRAHALQVKATVLEMKLSAAEAVPFAQEAVAIYERELGPHALATVQATRTLAGAQFRASRYAEAVTLYERAVREYEAALGPEHREVANSLHQLATAQKAMGRRLDGLATIERSLAINSRGLGPDHMWVGTNLAVVGQIQLELGRRDEAVATLERSIAIIEKNGGRKNGQLVAPLAYLCLAATAQPDGAARFAVCERARALIVELAGADSPITALVDTVYANGLETVDRLAEACAWIERPAAILAKADPQASDRATVLALQARCARSRGQPARAVELAREALALASAAFPAEHSDVASQRIELGAALIDAGDPAAAVPELEHALRSLATAEIDPGLRLAAEVELGAALRLTGAERARGEALLASSGPRLLASGYATPFLRRRVRAWLSPR